MLRSGDHGRIARWRRAMALARTLERRPDLLEARGGLTADEQAALGPMLDVPPYPPRSPSNPPGSTPP